MLKTKQKAFQKLVKSFADRQKELINFKGPPIKSISRHHPFKVRRENCKKSPQLQKVIGSG
jgi:hypothetical protein